jgi:hypothetical protein
MGKVLSLLRRHAAVSPDYEPIPRCDEEKEYEVMFFEEERLGPAALEARGDRCMASGRRRRGWSFAISQNYKEAALAYVLAENCRLMSLSLQLSILPNLCLTTATKPSQFDPGRKAAFAFSEHAVYELQVRFADHG